MAKLTEAQALAATSIEANVLVSAGAGSGKTTVLVQRYMEVLKSNPKFAPSNLIAVTYTRKAAGEMRNRIKQELESLLAENKGSITPERLLLWRAEIDSANIGTIHSLCETILRSYPDISGIDPGFEVLDELDRAKALKESIELALLDVHETSCEEESLLLAYPPDTIANYIKELIKSPLQFKEVQGCFSNLDSEGQKKHFNDLLVDWQLRILRDIESNHHWRDQVGYLAANPRPKEGDKLEAFRRQMLALGERVPHLARENKTSEAFAALTEMSKLTAGNTGGNSEDALAMRTAIRGLHDMAEEYTDGLPPHLVPEDDNAFTAVRLLVSLAGRALRHYEHRKQTLLKLDFDDLIRLADELLSKAGSDAANYFHHKVKALLVDEFQDTNRVASRLVRKLAGPDARIFLIGDDKQSIYKFQGADVACFNEWKKRLAGKSNAADLAADEIDTTDAQGLIVTLHDSFRSHPSIVGFVNHIFQNLFGAASEEDTWKASFQALDARRNDDPDASRIEIAGFNPSDHPEGRTPHTAKQMEADALACFIKQKIADQAPVLEKSGSTRPIEVGDFAVLVQTNKDFRSIEKALSQQNIPYMTMASSGFLERQEIYDLINLLSFLHSQQNSHALLGALRSPMFGISDDIICTLSQKSSEPLWNILSEQARGETLSELKRAFYILKQLTTKAGRVGLDELVKEIISATNYDLVLLGLPGGRQRSRNLWKFAALSVSYSHLSLGEFLEALKQMSELKIKLTEAPLSSQGAVKLMTIHASKGLEFPCVILPCLSAQAKDKSRNLIFNRAYGIAFDTTRDKDQEKPTSYLIARKIDQEMQLAEKKRLMYVAMTRARDYLALFVDDGAKNQLSFRRWLLDTVAPGEREFSEGQITVGTTFVCSQKINFAKLTTWQKDLPEGTSAELIESSAGISSQELLDPILTAGTDQHVPFQDLMRVTTTKKPKPLHATIVGTYFHALMEKVKAGPLSQAQLSAIAYSSNSRIVDKEQHALLIQLGKTLLDKYFQSRLHKLLQDSKHIFYETPYLVATAEESKSRRPDLIFKDNEGDWWIVDYKTDQFGLADIEKQAGAHYKQLDEYAQDLEMLTGLRPKACLYFAQHGILHELALKSAVPTK